MAQGGEIAQTADELVAGVEQLNMASLQARLQNAAGGGLPTVVAAQFHSWPIEEQLFYCLNEDKSGFLGKAQLMKFAMVTGFDP